MNTQTFDADETIDAYNNSTVYQKYHLREKEEDNESELTKEEK